MFSQVKVLDMEVLQALVALVEVMEAVEVGVATKDNQVHPLAPSCSQGHLAATEVTVPTPMQVVLVVVDCQSKLLIG